MPSRPLQSTALRLTRRATYRGYHYTTAVSKPTYLLPTSSRARYSSSSSSPSSDQDLIIRTDIPAPNTGHIRILELNRPAARNAISRALLSRLAQEVAAVHAQYGPDGEEIEESERFGGVAGPNRRGKTRALVLGSAVDQSFCAGADLKERGGMGVEETNDFLTSLRATLTSLSHLPIPTISSISSLALGGGLELALTTSFRVLSSTASVGLPETRLAIIPGAGGTYRLPALIGLNRARDLILTGRRVGAAEAYFLGIADRIVEVLPDDATNAGSASAGDGGSGKGKADGKTEAEKGLALLAKARKAALSESVRLAQEICEGGPVAVRAALRAVGFARVEVEEECYGRVVGTEDRDEALAAFGERRRPVYQGR